MFARLVRPVRASFRFKSLQCVRFYTSPGAELPFDLDDTDDKYKELNSFYTDLFTKSEEHRSKSVESIERSEIDELQSELNSVYSVGVLTPHELEKHTLNDGRFVIRSVSTDPYFNLALEDYVFRHTPLKSSGFRNERILFYTNDKCVVIGKNQNPWKEIYMKNIAHQGYDFVRRLSGGGAVVHDLGNVNYSYLTSRENFSREFFNQHLMKWLNNDQISLNERGDLTYKGHKISGSAFKIAKGKAYHHGTMLIDSDLSQFKGLLKPAELPGVEWTCNSVESVRSRVNNIGGEVVNSIDEFCSIVTQQFRDLLTDSDIPVYYCDENSSLPEITETAKKLNSEDWKFNSGPKFTVSCHGISIKVDKGSIVESDLPDLVGMPFYEFYDRIDEKNEMFKALL